MLDWSDLRLIGLALVIISLLMSKGVGLPWTGAKMTRIAFFMGCVMFLVGALAIHLL
jgi:hypothetical protein